MDWKPEFAAMVLLTVVLVVGIVCVTVVFCLATWRAGSSEPALLTKIFAGDNSLRLLTVGLVIACAAYLALSGVLGTALGQAVASLFAGVSGYVLGSMKLSGSTP